MGRSTNPFVFLLACLVVHGVLSATVPVRVGVVLDMNAPVGAMGSTCISMALTDFYAGHGSNFKTRLVMDQRDSHGDVIDAATAALDLIKNVQVKAIIGPFTSMETDFVISLGDKSHVPIVTFTATSPYLTSIQSQYFFRTALSDSSQVRSIAAIIQAFGWRQVVPIYVDNEFGEGIMPYLGDALEEINVHTPYRSVITSSATDDQISGELSRLMSMQTRVFIVHMAKGLGSRLFVKAEQLGMMTGDYAWIITDAMANTLGSVDPPVFKSMAGVLGVRPYVPETRELDEFRARYDKQVQHDKGTTALNIFGLWAYDTVTALAMAVENAASVRDATFLMPNVSSNATDLESLGIFSAGPDLVQVLASTTFTGLEGSFKLIDHQLPTPAYEVINVVGPGAEVVGYWTPEKGIARQLNSTNNDSSSYSTLKTNFRDIIWPGNKLSPPKGWVLPVNEKKLRVLVPVKDGFSEFVHVDWTSDKSTVAEGFCIEIFDAVIRALPYGIPYEYIPFSTENHTSLGTYDEMVRQVSIGIYDALVGDVTITASRSQLVDFSLPFTESGISMVVPYIEKKNKAWMFLEPLTWQLWLTSLGSFIFIGVTIWTLEHRINRDFRGPFWYQLGKIFWFGFSTMVFAHKETILSNYSRALLILWFFLVLILTQSYTASLSSLLTVQQLQPSIADVNIIFQSNMHIGYQEGSFIYGFLMNMRINESRLLPYSSPRELYHLFQKGNDNGGIAAAFDEIPYLKRFLAEYCSGYTMVGPIYKTGGFGFVFPRESPLVSDISRTVLNVKESELMDRIEKTWLGDSSECSSTSVSSTQLGLESFWGLFVIVGTFAALSLLAYIVKFLHRHRHVLLRADPNSTIWRKIMELLQFFNQIDSDFRAPRNSFRYNSFRRRFSSPGEPGDDFIYVTEEDMAMDELLPESQQQEEDSQVPSQHIELVHQNHLDSQSLPREINSV